MNDNTDKFTGAQNYLKEERGQDLEFIYLKFLKYYEPPLHAVTKYMLYKNVILAWS